MQRLRQAKVRVTPARRALLGVLRDPARRHPSAADLAAAVQQALPDVHLSTIYRSLESLESLGIVDHVHLGHGRAIYHLADEPHQHLVCDRCGTVIEVPDDVFDEVAAAVRRAYGFTIRPQHFAMLGRCAACAQREAAGHQPGAAHHPGAGHYPGADRQRGAAAQAGGAGTSSEPR